MNPLYKPSSKLTSATLIYVCKLRLRSELLITAGYVTLQLLRKAPFSMERVSRICIKASSPYNHTGCAYQCFFSFK